MAYPLNTFNDAQPAPAPRTGVGRFTQEVVLVLGLALIIFATMALASYSPHDAWTMWSLFLRRKQFVPLRRKLSKGIQAPADSVRLLKRS